MDGRGRTCCPPRSAMASLNNQRIMVSSSGCVLDSSLRAFAFVCVLNLAQTHTLRVHMRTSSEPRSLILDITDYAMINSQIKEKLPQLSRPVLSATLWWTITRTKPNIQHFYQAGSRCWKWLRLVFGLWRNQKSILWVGTWKDAGLWMRLYLNGTSLPNDLQSWAQWTRDPESMC